VSDLVLRPMDDSEALAAMQVHLAAREDAVRQGTMPPSLHPPEDGPRWFTAEVVGKREIWVADDDGTLVGLLVLDTAFLDQLYVVPERQGEGIGTALLELAKARRPRGFGLWVFTVNAPAIRLYERHGMTVVQRGDGSGNEEGEPDLRYAWPGVSVGAVGEDRLA
jgi:GNAT superfamily N-acetyltransferase